MRTRAALWIGWSMMIQATLAVMNIPPGHINLCPDAYLFEFMGDPGGLEAAQQMSAFQDMIGNMKSVRVRQSFGRLLNGISAQVSDGEELRQIMAMDGLKMATPLTIVSPPEQANPSRSVLVTSALNMTGASRVQQEYGLTGKGVKVGIIDTGIDYTHPALGGCFGPNCKVAFGYDFVGDAFTGKNTPETSLDPMDCAGHGSHVAGIVGASNEVVMGVAPQVLLGAYKVLGCNGSSNDDMILAALERAVDDGMDVINLSIGEPNGWLDNPVARALNAVRSLGVMVTVSQGNENVQGLFSANYVGVSRSVMAVASFVNTRFLLSYFTLSLDPSFRFLFKKAAEVKGMSSSLPLIAFLNGTTLGTGCDPLPDAVEGKVVLVLRGDCYFAHKAQNALDKGAVGIIFVNNAPGTLEPDVGHVKITTGFISKVPGDKLFEVLRTKLMSTVVGNVTAVETRANFGQDPEVFVHEAGGTASRFSSYGLDNELHIKPDIGAPGENIFSTWPMNNGSYMTLSGTSMASPHVAGALALALQHWRDVSGKAGRPTWSQIQQIYDIFRNTAQPTHVFRNHEVVDPYEHPSAPTPEDDLDPGRSFFDFGDARLDSVAKQGSGMLNIYRAIASISATLGSNKAPPNHDQVAQSSISFTVVSPSTIELNDTEFATSDPQQITIYNHGTKVIQYELSHLPAEALHELAIEPQSVKLKEAAVFDAIKSVSAEDNVQGADGPAVVDIPTKIISVPPGGHRRVPITISPPANLPEDQHWIYSGYIVVRALSTPTETHKGNVPDTIHVPYAGVKGKIKTLPIFLRPTPQELAADAGRKFCQVLGGGLANKTDFIFTMDGKDIPIISFCVANPTRFLILDVIRPGTTESDYSLVGRVATNERVPRSLATAVVTAVQWNGTLDLETETIGPNNRLFRDAVHREPGMDLLYGMRATPSDDKSALDHGTRENRMLARRLADTEHRKASKEILAESRGPRNQHLLRQKTSTGEAILVPDGDYRLRLRGLRIMGDLENPQDYDTWITPTFTIARARPLSASPPIPNGSIDETTIP